MAIKKSMRGWRHRGARAALAVLSGLGVLAAGWVWPGPAAAQGGLVVPRGGDVPGGHWAPPAQGGGHAPDAWSHRGQDDPGWRHRRPGWSGRNPRWYGRHPGWYGSHPGWYRNRGPVYCPGEWIWTGWRWAWVPGC